MASVPVQVLHGVYLGLLAGVIPALVAFGLGFLFRYVIGLSIPAFGVVVLGVALAGVNGGLLAFADPTITSAANATTLVVALLVVLMMSLYSHAVGDRLGTELPRRISLRSLRDRTLNADVVDFVGGRREVTVRVVGAVRDVEGYPPLPDSLRSEIRSVEWSFPADVPLSELESRFLDRLRSEFDVQEVTVSIDEKARAAVAAAPPAAGVSKRVPLGKRAVSVTALVPTGVARGDEVTVVADDTAITGTVLSVTAEDGPAAADEPTATDGGEPEPAPPASVPTAAGGVGRVTVAVERADARELLTADDARVVVRAGGVRREYELVALLRRAGQRVRRLTLAADAPVAGSTLADADVQDVYGVAVLAVRHGGSWTIAPHGDAELGGGDDVFVVGERDALDAFEGVVS